MDRATVPPVHLYMSSCVDRLLTLYHWNCNLRQTPYQLACEGFFHEGDGDYLTCYKCGNTLKYWQHKNFSVDCSDRHCVLPYPPKHEK